MRVIMFSWEYPPKIVGGISPHVYGLAHALAAQGAEVHVVTCEHPGAAAEELEDGIHLYRVTPSGPGNDFIHWVQLLNDAMLAPGRHSPSRNCWRRTRTRRCFSMPMTGSPTTPPPRSSTNIICRWSPPSTPRSMAATAAFKGPTQEYINSVEWHLQNEAWRVIVCTEFMKRECDYMPCTRPGTRWTWSRTAWMPISSICPSLRPKSARRSAPSYAAPEEKIIFFRGPHGAREGGAGAD